MKKNILSLVITLGEGAFLLWIGISAIQGNAPELMDYGKLAGGLSLVILGIINFIWLVLKTKDIKTPLYINIGLGFLIFVIGLSIRDNNWMSSAIMVPGSLLMFINFPALLKKKISKDKDLSFKGFLLAGFIFI